MALINDVFRHCKRLARHGWRELLAAHGLDIKQRSPRALAVELARGGLPVNRALAGFEDFAAAGVRGVEPGSPARSLLYHALASPNVLNGPDGRRLNDFPTLREIEDVENYVFSVARRSIDDLLTLADADELAIVVFAYEYRPAPQTCHKLHADMVYSRTGVARVGTAAANFRPELRGFLPSSESDPLAICVSPSRFAAYLAVQRAGDPSEFRPLRFQARPPRDKGSDRKRQFWVPLHKLFSGDECLVGRALKVKFSATHFNEKLRRIHLSLGRRNSTALNKWPFRFSSGIASLVKGPRGPSGLVVPDLHRRLVEPVRLGRRLLTFEVECRPANGRYSSYTPKQNGLGGHSAPEFVHARTEVRAGHVELDLNNDPQRPNVLKTVLAGGYQALHYLDFTGDGWVQASVEGFNRRSRQVNLDVKAAYSLVAACDFFPLADQRELTEWTQSNEVPQSFRDEIWGIPPDPLCDSRRAANIQLPKHPFDRRETTVTALVGLVTEKPTVGNPPLTPEAQRHSHLPDDAAGFFDPGWEVSSDVDPGSREPHLAAYGLGSPFPEDVKLCAALSTFWPTVAPDSTRQTEPDKKTDFTHTVCPLTDAEIGQVGNLAWDATEPPKLLIDGQGQEVVEYASFQHVDYVRAALGRGLSLHLTALADAREYEARVFSMALVNRALDPDPERWGDWVVLHFQRALVGWPELQEAVSATGAALGDRVYRFEMFRWESLPVPADFRKRRVRALDRRMFFVDPQRRVVLWRPINGPWQRAQVPHV